MLGFGLGLRLGFGLGPKYGERCGLTMHQGQGQADGQAGGRGGAGPGQHAQGGETQWAGAPGCAGADRLALLVCEGGGCLGGEGLPELAGRLADGGDVGLSRGVLGQGRLDGSGLLGVQFAEGVGGQAGVIHVEHGRISLGQASSSRIRRRRVWMPVWRRNPTFETDSAVIALISL